MANYEKIHQILRNEDRSNWKSMISELVYEDIENHELIMKDNPNESIPILLESLDLTWTSGFKANSFVKDSAGKVFFVNGYAPLDSNYIPEDKDSNAMRILTHGDTVDLVDVYDNELYHNEVFSNETPSSEYIIIDKSEAPDDLLSLLRI